MNGHEVKTMWINELYPNGKTEAFIIMEHTDRFTAMRIVASPEDIEEQRAHLEETGRYESVTITQRVK